ncbi:MAG: PAS domain-containing protein [Chloroflexales bacterium]
MQGEPNGTHDLAAENAALRAELARYQTLVAQMTLGAYIYRLEDRADDHSLRMVVANQAVEALTGVPASAQIGKTLDENFPGLREQGIPQAYADVVRTGTPFAQEVAYGDGRVISSAFAMRALPLPNDELVVFFDNITARKQAESLQNSQALHESQELLETLFDHLPIAVMLKDATDGRYILRNSACQHAWNPRRRADREERLRSVFAGHCRYFVRQGAGRAVRRGAAHAARRDFQQRPCRDSCRHHPRADSRRGGQAPLSADHYQ